MWWRFGGRQIHMPPYRWKTLLQTLSSKWRKTTNGLTSRMCFTSLPKPKLIYFCIPVFLWAIYQLNELYKWDCCPVNENYSKMMSDNMLNALSQYCQSYMCCYCLLALQDFRLITMFLNYLTDRNTIFENASFWDACYFQELNSRKWRK